MSNWSSGYVVDVDYTHGYYHELNPLRTRLAFLDAGIVYPEFGTACELGFGQGVSINLHAAASSTQWFGTDFNPAQTAFAQELAAAAGSGAHLVDEAFADFAMRTDMPDFDYIGLHGIWSWISRENQRIVIDFIRRKLKPGGVLYISYNTMPGWAPFAPMQHLMKLHDNVLAPEGKNILERIDDAMAFANGLLEANPLYGRVNTSVKPRLDSLKDKSRNYLAHEFFNSEWNVAYFAEMAGLLESAKLSFACSAYYFDHVDALNLTPAQQAFLNKTPNALFRESVRDFMVNQQFRRDYWVKGVRKLTALERLEAQRDIKVMLAVHRADVSLKVKGALGEATMTESIYAPVLDLLADHKPRTLGEIEQALKAQQITHQKILQVALILAGAGYLELVQEASIAVKAKKSTDKLNAHLLKQARSGSELAHLASPVTGGGVNVGNLHQLFLLAITQGKKQPSECAQFANDILVATGRSLKKENKNLSAEENLKELETMAASFFQKRLPVLRALQIV